MKTNKRNNNSILNSFSENNQIQFNLNVQNLYLLINEYP